MSEIDDAIDEQAQREWGMSAAELDGLHIQKPIGQVTIRAVRWKSLPMPAFRRHTPVTGTRDELVHNCFIHPAEGECVSSGRHIAGGSYVVDPHAPDRVLRFLALWKHPDDS
jgi:hypothetical protein